jgi:hypothetical protein
MPIGSAMVIVPKVSSSDNTAGLFIFIGVVDIFGSKVVFDHFIFNDTHAGFGNGHFSERDSSICSSQSGGAEDFINLFLSEIGIFTLGFFTRSTSAFSSAILVTAIMLS